MSFPRDAKYIQDWSPASGLSYHTFLQKKRYETPLSYAMPEPLLKLIASDDQLDAQGYNVAAQQSVPNYRILNRDVSSLEQSIALGASEVTSPLRWNMSLLAIGMPRVNDTPEMLNAPGELAAAASPWAYEQFIQARGEYIQGHYKAALDLISQAINGAEMHLGHASDYRLPYLLGRIRIGSWFGTYKNAIRDIIDTEKAETAFLDAARLLHQMPPHPQNKTDGAHCMLWAARAAYFHGDLTRAIGNTAQALDTLRTAGGSLYTAGQYQYAKMLCTRASGSDLSAATDILTELITSDRQLLLEAVCEPQFIAHGELLEQILKDARGAAQKTYRKSKDEISVLVRKLNNYSFADMAAVTLLHSEIHDISEAHDQAEEIAEQDGLLNLLDACRRLTGVQPKPGYLFSLFRTRFREECSREWENMPVTRDAQYATDHFKSCEENFKKAEDYYRKHGGFNRNGGQDKLGYAVISSLLTIYMLAAQSYRGGHAIVLALFFLIAAAWLYWAYFRIRLGLVEGYDDWRRAKAALEKAQHLQDRKNSSASKAWNYFQRNIDNLGSVKAPF